MRRLVLLVATALFASTFLMTPAAQASSWATLHGVVRDAKTGEAVAGMNVDAVRQSDGWVLGSTTTDGTGSWSFEVPASSYKVGVIGFSGRYASQWATGKPDEASADVLVLGDGSDTQLDFNLAPYPTISGRITDTRGAPVVGFCPAFPIGDLAAGNAGGGSCTNAQGRYTTPMSWQGEFRARFLDFQKPYADQWYGGVSKPDHATVLNAAGADITGIDAVLRPEATITVRLTDERHQVLGGCVAAYDLTGYIAASACTGDPGAASVTMHQLPAGTYVIWSYDYTYRHVTRYLGGTKTAVGAKQLKLRTGQHARSETIKLPLGGVIAGTITDRVTGLPVTSACIDITGTTVEQSARVYGQEATKATCADANGHVELVGLETGRYPIEVLDLEGGYASVFLPSSPDTKDLQTYAVTLGKTTTVNASLLVGGTISGEVSYADGLDHGLVCIAAYSARTGDQVGFGLCPHHPGSYSVSGLGTNDYIVKTVQQPDGYPETYAPGVTSAASAAHAAVTVGKQTSGVDLVLHPSSAG